jgi:NAD(P)-dependent dehydrogenase (short-subunit alcohol dehydrogenase family)
MAEASRPAQSVEGMRAVVTGGGSGIGAELVSQLVHGGAKVLAADLDARGLEAVAAATGASTMVVDVADGQGANTAMLAEAVAALGGVDLVFLNAGILGRPIADQGAPYTVADLDSERYRAVAAVNIDGVVFGTLAAAEVMSGGAIIATASAAGLVPWAPDPFYTATKHAVVGWVRAIAPALAAQGVTIDAICPGGVATPLVGANADDAADRPNLLAPAQVAEAMITTALEPGTGRAVSVVAGREQVRQEHLFGEIPGFG